MKIQLCQSTSKIHGTSGEMENWLNDLFWAKGYGYVECYHLPIKMDTDWWTVIRMNPTSAHVTSPCLSHHISLYFLLFLADWISIRQEMKTLWLTSQDPFEARMEKSPFSYVTSHETWPESFPPYKWGGSFRKYSQHKIGINESRMRDFSNLYFLTYCCNFFSWDCLKDFEGNERKTIFPAFYAYWTWLYTADKR